MINNLIIVKIQILNNDNVMFYKKIITKDILIFNESGNL